MITKKKISLEIAFRGTGRVVQGPPGTFTGEALAPEVANSLQFNLLDEAANNSSASSLAGRFQVNMWGSAEGYRALGSYFLALAELDTSADPDHHEHHEFQSFDGRTILQLIARKTQ